MSRYIAQMKLKMVGFPDLILFHTEATGPDTGRKWMKSGLAFEPIWARASSTFIAKLGAVGAEANERTIISIRVLLVFATSTNTHLTTFALLAPNAWFFRFVFDTNSGTTNSWRVTSARLILARKPITASVLSALCTLECTVASVLTSRFQTEPILRGRILGWEASATFSHSVWFATRVAPVGWFSLHALTILLIGSSCALIVWVVTRIASWFFNAIAATSQQTARAGRAEVGVTCGTAVPRTIVVTVMMAKWLVGIRVQARQSRIGRIFRSGATRTRRHLALLVHRAWLTDERRKKFKSVRCLCQSGTGNERLLGQKHCLDFSLLYQ